MDWNDFKFLHSRIPYDVKFRVMDQNGYIHDISAHKHILALASRVFSKQFFPTPQDQQVGWRISDNTAPQCVHTKNYYNIIIFPG